VLCCASGRLSCAIGQDAGSRVELVRPAVEAYPAIAGQSNSGRCHLSETAEFDWSSLEGVQKILECTPIHRHLGFRCESIERGAACVVFSCPVGDAALRMDGVGQVHGGILATLIDSAATFAACIAAGRSVPTAALHVDYLRPTSGSDLVATAKVRKIGRSTAVVDVEVESGGKLVALGRAALSTTVSH
jgi:uncharacterized protein (TIGR00369 family)